MKRLFLVLIPTLLFSCSDSELYLPSENKKINDGVTFDSIYKVPTEPIDDNNANPDSAITQENATLSIKNS